MARPQMDYHNTTDIPWVPVAGAAEGIYEKVLNRDPETGTYSRLIRMDPGVMLAPAQEHEFYEEVYLVEGDVVDLGQSITLEKGAYAYRHPGMRHGPFTSRKGSVSFEVRTYVK